MLLLRDQGPLEDVASFLNITSFSREYHEVVFDGFQKTLFRVLFPEMVILPFFLRALFCSLSPSVYIWI